MEIEVLGTGCYNCMKLDLMINEVLQELGISGVELMRIDDERQIRKVMPPDQIPGLVINCKLVSTRTVPDKETLKQWLMEGSNE